MSRASRLTWVWVAMAAAFAMSAGQGHASTWERLKDEGDGTCGFAGVFDGPGSTTLLVSQDQRLFDRGVVAVSIANENWSIRLGDDIKDTIKFDAAGYEFWANPVAIDHGLVLYVSPHHLKEFAETFPTSVTVWKGEEIIDKLNFSDFWAEHLMFDACVSKKRRAKAERERLESLERDLPRDPFSGK